MVACPHCGVVLDPPPKANRKCPDCREPIKVRTRDGAKLVFTPEGAVEYDRKRQAEFAYNAARRRADALGLSDTEAEWERTRRAKSEQFRQEPSGGDIFWSLANETALEAAKSGDWHRAGMAYFQMGLHLKEEGRDFYTVRREASRCFVRHDVNQARSAGHDRPQFRVLGVTGDDERQLCAVDHERAVTAEELMSDEPPIPHRYLDGTTWCPCNVVIDWESSRSTDLGQLSVEPEPQRTEPAKRGLLGRIFGNG